MFAADGRTLDLEASARKVADAHGHLERRLGSGDAPPATAADYKLTVPESLAERIKAEDLAKSTEFVADLGKLHAAGLSQKQVDAVVGVMLERSVKLQDTMPTLVAAEAEAELRQVDGWKSDAEYQTNVRRAYSAAKAYAGADMAAIEKRYGNDPVIMRLLAKVGAEISEDSGVPPEAQAQLQESADALMNSAAYLNGNDPKHAETVAKVSALQARLSGTKPVPNGRTMSFKT